MAISFSGSAQIKIALDTDFTKLLFSESFSLIDSATWDEGGSKHFDVADSATETVDLDGIATGGFLWVKSDRQVDLLVTSAAGTDQAIRLGNSATDEGFAMFKGPFTAIKITNNSGASANVTIGMIGA